MKTSIFLNKNNSTEMLNTSIDVLNQTEKNIVNDIVNYLTARKFNRDMNIYLIQSQKSENEYLVFITMDNNNVFMLLFNNQNITLISVNINWNDIDDIIDDSINYKEIIFENNDIKNDSHINKIYTTNSITRLNEYEEFINKVFEFLKLTTCGFQKIEFTICDKLVYITMDDTLQIECNPFKEISESITKITFID